MEETIRTRYCAADGCIHSFGTKDPTIIFFRTPDKVTAAEQRRLWKEAIYGNSKDKRLISFYNLCHLHFRPEDIITFQNRPKLKKGVVPIPFAVVPKVEIKEEPNDEPDPLHVEPVKRKVYAGAAKIADKSSSDAANQFEHCEGCIEINYSLQRAVAKIHTLTAKVNMLTAENRVLKSKLQVKVGTQSLVGVRSKCELCRVDMTTVGAKQHICLDQDSIACTFCNDEISFNSIQSFLKHMNYHVDDINEAKRNKLFKCGKCTIAYPLEILLKCHERSHIDVANIFDINIENDKLTALKEIKSEPIDVDANDDECLVTIEVVDESSAGDNGLEDDDTVVVDLDELPEDVTKAIQSMSSSTSNENSTKTMIAKLFKCSICGMTFETTKEIALHMRRGHETDIDYETTIFTCTLCNESFSNIEDYRKHMRGHERSTKCDVCKLPRCMDELDTHLCGDQEQIQCDYCDQMFKVTTKLVEHLQSHDNQRFYHCKHCHLYFGMKILRDYHEEQHVKKAKYYKCETCSKTFATKNNLISHMGTHEADRCFLCDECGKEFVTARSLQYHKRSLAHGHEPTIQCPDCPKKFFHIGALKRHSDLHREHKFVCDICQTELQSLNGYQDHMKRHRRTEADRKFACNICPRKFFNKTDLKAHQISHTNQKRFKCQYCKQSYKYSGDLNKHLKSHVGNKIYKCPKCPMRFQYPLELQKHSFKHYKEEKEKGIVQ